MAVSLQKGVELRWDFNPEPDIAGYDLYRKAGDEGDFQKINTRLITENYFLDGSADPQKTYLYLLKALDNSPSANASDFSQEAEVSPQQPIAKP